MIWYAFGRSEGGRGGYDKKLRWYTRERGKYGEWRRVSDNDEMEGEVTRGGRDDDDE